MSSLNSNITVLVIRSLFGRSYRNTVIILQFNNYVLNLNVLIRNPLY